MPQLPHTQTHTHIHFPLRLNSGNHNFYLRRFLRLAPFLFLPAAHVRRPLDTNYINKRTTKDAAMPHMRISSWWRGGGRSAQKLFQFSPFYRKLRTIQYLAFLLSLVLYPAVVVCLFSAWLATKCQGRCRKGAEGGKAFVCNSLLLVFAILPFFACPFIVNKKSHTCLCQPRQCSPPAVATPPSAESIHCSFALWMSK